MDQLKERWYTDTEGNISECAAHMPRDGEIDNDDTIAWRKKYWDSFYRDITTKTKDWKYEQEWRLILEDRSSKFDKQKNHTLIYDFNSLKGIIFGINASDKNRLEVITIIQKSARNTSGAISNFIRHITLQNQATFRSMRYSCREAVTERLKRQA